MEKGRVKQLNAKLFFKQGGVEMSAQDATRAILSIQGDVYVMGINPSGANEINSVLQKLQQRDIAPVDAVDEAKKIYNRDAD